MTQQTQFLMTKGSDQINVTDDDLATYLADGWRAVSVTYSLDAEGSDADSVILMVKDTDAIYVRPSDEGVYEAAGYRDVRMLYGAEQVQLEGSGQIGFFPTYHLNFDGIDDKVVIPTSVSLGGLANGTIEFWFKSPGGDTDYHKLIQLGNALDIGINDGGSPFGEISGVGNLGVFGAGNWEDGIWHHLALTWDGSFLRAYLDGEYKTKTAQLGTQGSPDTDFYIAVSASNSEWFKGSIRELRYSDAARYTTEGSFSVPSSNFIADANTIVLLHIDEGTDVTAADTSGNNNDGTITGATWELD